jgi:choline/glycine/proline betaine transport protein
LHRTNLAPRESLIKVPWQRRLRTLVQFPRRVHVNRFIEEVVEPAMIAVAEEIKKQGITVVVNREGKKDRVRIAVCHGDEMDFLYEVRPRAYVRPAFSLLETKDSENGEVPEEKKYFRAEVHLREGGQDYDLMGWSKDQVIHDILDQYEKHMHFLHMVR